MKKIFIIILIFLCGNVKSQNIDSLSQKIIKEIKLDSLGCLGTREKYIGNGADDFLYKKILKNKSKEYVIELFGQPSSMFTILNGTVTFTYQVHSNLCHSNDTNIPIFKIIFKRNKVRGIAYYKNIK